MEDQTIPLVIYGEIILSSTERPIDRVFVTLAAVVRSDGNYINFPASQSSYLTGSDGKFEFRFLVRGDQLGDLADAHIRITVTDHRDGGIAQTTTRFSARTTSHPLIQSPRISVTRGFNYTDLFQSYSSRERVINNSFGTHRGVSFINNTPFAKFGLLFQRVASLYNSVGAALRVPVPSPENFFYFSVPYIRVS